MVEACRVSERLAKNGAQTVSNELSLQSTLRESESRSTADRGRKKSPSEPPSQQNTCSRDSRTLVYFALDSFDEKVFAVATKQRRRFWQSDEPSVPHYAPAPVCCAVFRAGHAR